MWVLRGKHLNSGIRGGLWEEQHFQRIGPAVWLFGWLIHRQTRERDGVGLVLAGSPLTYQIIGQDTGIAERTLKRWMARLARAGYVQVTHTAHKRMIIRITKAKKFGPQQLGFPQKQFAFPQTPFFTPKSKGPVSAPSSRSKGPSVAQDSKHHVATRALETESCVHAPAGHREFIPERKQTERQSIRRRFNSNTSISTSCNQSSEKAKTVPQVSHLDSLPVRASPPPLYPTRYGPDRKAVREMELRAELRVGMGPVIRRE